MESQENQSNRTYPNFPEDNEESRQSPSDRDEFSESNSPNAFESISSFTYRNLPNSQDRSDPSDMNSEDAVSSDPGNQSDTYSSEYLDDYEESEYSASDMEDFSEFDLPIEFVHGFPLICRFIPLNGNANGNTDENDTIENILNDNNMRFFGFQTLSELLRNMYRNREQNDDFQVELVNPTIQSEDILSHPYLVNMVHRSDDGEGIEELTNPYPPQLQQESLLKNVHIFLLDRIQTYPGKIIPLFTTIYSEADLFLRCLRHEPNPPLLCIAGCRMNAFDNDLHFGCLVHVRRGYLHEEDDELRLGVLLECVQPCEVLKYSRNRDRATLGTVRLCPFHGQLASSEEPSIVALFSRQCAQIELPSPPLLGRNSDRIACRVAMARKMRSVERSARRRVSAASGAARSARKQLVLRSDSSELTRSASKATAKSFEVCRRATRR